MSHSAPLEATKSYIKSEMHEFKSIFPNFVRDLTDETKKYNRSEASEWFNKVLHYNLGNGKNIRALITISAYKTLVEPDQLTPENLRKIQCLAWCLELISAVAIVIDDIMDASTTRRGQPCWYKNEDVGMIAINDSFMMQGAMYSVLKKYFRHTNYYINLVELIHEALLITSIGQSLDVRTAQKEVTSFSIEQYRAIVEHKTSFYSFYLPVALAMTAAGYTDSEVFSQVKSILLEMGYFFQVQDDFIDCFGDPELIGKNGTDIQDNKCTWLSATFMQNASPEQKEIMKECYGKNDLGKVKRVKELYVDLGLPNTYKLYEEDAYHLIKTHIQGISKNVPHNIFYQIMEMLYRRTS